MTSQNIALWALINTQSKGGYSNRKKGRYRKLITITFDWIGIFWWGFQQNNSLKAFYQHPENQAYFKFLCICPLNILGQVHAKIYVGSFSFQSLLSHKYGYTAFPRVIEAEEFETIIGAMESQTTKDLFHKYD